LQGSIGAATSVCSLPPLWGRAGEGGGAGEMMVAPPAKESHHPHPQPLPTRGRGAHRVCERIVRQTETNALQYIAAVVPFSQRQAERVPIPPLQLGAACLIEVF